MATNRDQPGLSIVIVTQVPREGFKTQIIAAIFYGISKNLTNFSSVESSG